ncbi:MAG: cytochrome c oxidase assembly protein [Gemmatimonadota bacterium]
MSAGTLLGLWEFEPSVVVGCGLLAVAYLELATPRTAARTLAFLAGDVVVLLALVSPLDPLGDDVLFSAHMLQHILLALVAPPLLVMGLPDGTARRLLALPALHRSVRRLARPAIAWPLFVGTLWAWHLPALYDAALHHEGLHVFEHLTFLATGVVFWWPVATSLAEWRMSPPRAAFYLFFAGLANTLLGILITFVPRVLYTPYINPPDPEGLLPFFRNVWGLTPAADQALGGVLMWVVGMAVFAVALAVHVGLMLRASGAPDRRRTTLPIHATPEASL